MKRYGHEYEDLYQKVKTPLHPLGYFQCIYCGMPADTMDHVPPISRVACYKSMKLKHEFFLKVPCCNQCNLVLSNSLQDTILRRIEFLKKRLSKKLAKKLRVADFTDDEIKEMDRVLASDVRRSIIERDESLDRIDYTDGQQFIFDFFDNKGVLDELEDESGDA